MSIKRENFNFLLIGFTLILSAQVILSGMTMGVNTPCYWLENMIGVFVKLHNAK